MTKKNKDYTTSVSLTNVTRNKLIALANIRGTTQKQLLSKLVDKEVAHLNPTDKNNFMNILNAIEIKDNFKK
ncbi:DUF5388 domain-containing protein [Limosilactobacillus reuteri]|uniref:Uncharacterized protein n=2 Tax=Limosilactobacillus reuteri TaxID=1598 RepID=F8DLC8_LIMRS|nr:DUF5388 domain-containing protein [Limosilactobacillus reuteri]AEI57668.1 hypothetical protein HMPREF0538_21459 [Limosilactobacillus reuteri SD2112]EEI66239.1 hypothetical protein HMPREF0534_0438 [Limosilactobacillus reuteri CF48-3A]MBU5983565.1 DUF5388 domain-containing protein [Limosilactobacillus reuteri]MCC4451129.1 DUF5388 domain-containing protein [Limosilactobacillus reuteri]MCC4453072.1 DUF5388 domain-containing protein [Limosilactobacillus reuteri]